MTQRSPSRSARVVRPARSDPAPGSLKSWHQATRPSRIGGTSRVDLVGRAVGEDRRRGHQQAEPAGRTQRTERRRSAERTMAEDRRGRPRPPCSGVKCGAVQPASATMRHHSSTSKLGVPVRRPATSSHLGPRGRRWVAVCLRSRPPAPSSSRQLSRMILRHRPARRSRRAPWRSRAGGRAPRRGASRSRTGSARRR